MKLAGKVAIVTGAGSGQGRVVSQLFAKEGARIVVADVDSAAGEETNAIIHAEGGDSIFVKCDVSLSQQVQEMIRRTVAAFGTVDILYNNAALGHPNPPVSEAVADMPEEHWQKTIDINLTGCFLCSKYALREMLKHGSGVIINISSVMGIMAREDRGAYMASKAGLIGLTKSMALDYGPRGIRVNVICPGTIDTPRTRTFSRSHGMAAEELVRKQGEKAALRRIGTSEEVAKVALFLASDDSSFMTGATVSVDGGRLAA